MARYTIIPDVHGRPFWRDAVRDIDEAPAVFLGDYLDPYPQDGVTWDEAWQGLADIVALKKCHPNRVTLLLGNHDVHYLPGYPFFNTGSRYDYGHAEMIREFFMANLRWFDMASFIPRQDGDPFLLSHAGVSRSWLREMHFAARPDCATVCELLFRFIDAGENPPALAALLNEALHTGDQEVFRFFMSLLGSVPSSRGGRSSGSMVWKDYSDMVQAAGDDLIHGCVQIVGHTRQDTFIELPFRNGASQVCFCTDFGRAFTLEEGGQPFLRIKNELKTSFYASDLAAVPSYFIFGLWLWNLSDEARAEAMALIHTAVGRDEIRIFEEGAYYFWRSWMALFEKKGELDLPDWVAAQWRRIKPLLRSMRPEDLSTIITGWKM